MFKKVIILSLILITCICNISKAEEKKDKLIMGGHYKEPANVVVDEEQEVSLDNDGPNYSLEKFFRPSNLRIINDGFEKELYDMYGEEEESISIPVEFINNGDKTIINYFNVLREAAYPTEKTRTGCGTLGEAQGPYPVAYNFFSKEYKNKITYKQFLKSFENILHINLIKLDQVRSEKEDEYKFFIELEVIEGSNEQKGLFSYYYGFITVKSEDNKLLISGIDYSPENYLCAPYHGWSYDAKLLVQYEYGDWCSLIDGDITVESDGYKKSVYFKGKDQGEYCVLFYELTNGTDIKIQDYKKDESGQWISINIDPKKCVEKNS